MQLLTKDIKSKLPSFHDIADMEAAEMTCHAKLFLADGGLTWYVLAGDQHGDNMILYGLVIGSATEGGNFSLLELESLRGKFGLSVERDVNCDPNEAYHAEIEAA